MADMTTELPRIGMTLSEATSILSGLHFAQESLTDTEREILRIAEGLLRLINPTAYGLPDPQDDAITFLVSALERTERNLDLSIRQLPVRDYGENLVENARAYMAAQRAGNVAAHEHLMTR